MWSSGTGSCCCPGMGAVEAFRQVGIGRKTGYQWVPTVSAIAVSTPTNLPDQFSRTPDTQHNQLSRSLPAYADDRTALAQDRAVNIPRPVSRAGTVTLVCRRRRTTCQ
jgi:hypothetical protein